jgi:hypothetical protein
LENEIIWPYCRISSDQTISISGVIDPGFITGINRITVTDDTKLHLVRVQLSLPFG